MEDLNPVVLTFISKTIVNDDKQKKCRQIYFCLILTESHVANYTYTDEFFVQVKKNTKIKF